MGSVIRLLRKETAYNLTAGYLPVVITGDIALSGRNAITVKYGHADWFDLFHYLLQIPYFCACNDLSMNDE